MAKKRVIWAIDLNGSPLNQFGPKELEIYTDEDDKVNIAIDGEVISGEILHDLKEGSGTEVIPNVELSGGEPDLESLEINGVTYVVPTGGGVSSSLINDYRFVVEYLTDELYVYDSNGNDITPETQEGWYNLTHGNNIKPYFLMTINGISYSGQTHNEIITISNASGSSPNWTFKTYYENLYIDYTNGNITIRWDEYLASPCRTNAQGLIYNDNDSEHLDGIISAFGDFIDYLVSLETERGFDSPGMTIKNFSNLIIYRNYDAYDNDTFDCISFANVEVEFWRNSEEELTAITIYTECGNIYLEVIGNEGNYIVNNIDWSWFHYPASSGDGSTYDLEDTPALTLTVHRKEEEQVTGWPREHTYKIISNIDYQSSSPLSSSYTSLKEAIDEIVEAKPSKILMDCTISNYNDDESVMDDRFDCISYWTLTGQYHHQEDDNEELSLVYTTTILSGILVSLIIRKGIIVNQETQYWFMIQSPEIKMYGEPVLQFVFPEH